VALCCQRVARGPRDARVAKCWFWGCVVDFPGAAAAVPLEQSDAL